MSRKVLIVAVVLGFLVATLVAPATAAPLGADGADSAQTEAWGGFGGGQSDSPTASREAGSVIRPNGGCETGGAGVRVAGTAVRRNGLAVGVGCTCAKKLHPRIMPRAKDATARNAILRYALVMDCSSYAVC